MDNSKIYNLAIIGFGGMAGHHFTQLSKGEVRVRIKGIYDLKEDRREAAHEKGLYVYESNEAIFADPEVDIVLVAATNEVHKDLSIAALRAGKHVLCEKPVTLTSAELEEIMAVAKETGKIFTIDQNRRVNKDYLAMRSAVESGIIGKPYVIETRVEGSRGMPEGWRRTKALGGGMMFDWGVHLIDQLMYMNKSKVVNVFCKMYSILYDEVDDNFHLVLTFEDGLSAYIEISTNNFILHPRWYVLGTEGTLQIDSWEGTGRVVKVKDREDTWTPDIKITKAGPSKTMGARDPSTVSVTEVAPPEGIEDNLNPVYRQLVDAIEGAPLKITAEQALRVVKVMEAAFESASTGEAVKLSV